jgi:tRNA(adenine34) deaminase
VRMAFEDRVASKVARLSARSLRAIEAETVAKRTAWWKSRNPGSSSYGHSGKPTPRLAFELLFFDYMGLPPHDLAVLRESDHEIVWASRNPCTTLEACRQLGLDTRTVCRNACEKPTQAFVSCIDPELRFHRDYNVIRPASDHCLEWIVRVPFDERMRLAIEEAQRSREEGNKGYGAVAVLGDRLLARGHDTAVTGHDPSLHGEVNVIRQAIRELGSDNLSGVVLFSTCEPCPMCSALAVWANVSAIVFGASAAETAARGKRRILIPASEVVSKSDTHVEVFPGILHDECLALYA